MHVFLDGDLHGGGRCRSRSVRPRVELLRDELAEQAIELGIDGTPHELRELRSTLAEGGGDHLFKRERHGRDDAAGAGSRLVGRHPESPPSSGVGLLSTRSR